MPMLCHQNWRENFEANHCADDVNFSIPLHASSSINNERNQDAWVRLKMDSANTPASDWENTSNSPENEVISTSPLVSDVDLSVSDRESNYTALDRVSEVNNNTEGDGSVTQNEIHSGRISIKPEWMLQEAALGSLST